MIGAALLAAGLFVTARWARGEEPWHDAPQALVRVADPGQKEGDARGHEASAAAGGLDAAGGVHSALGGEEAEGLAWEIGKTSIALIAVCALIYVFVRYGLRRFTGARNGPEGLFRVIARFGLEPKKVLYIVEVSGKSMLLASSETGVRFLAHLDPPSVRRGAEAGSVLPALVEDRGGAATFYQILQRKLDRPALERMEADGLPAAPGSAREDVS